MAAFYDKIKGYGEGGFTFSSYIKFPVSSTGKFLASIKREGTEEETDLGEFITTRGASNANSPINHFLYIANGYGIYFLHPNGIWGNANGLYLQTNGMFILQNSTQNNGIKIGSSNSNYINFQSNNINLQSNNISLYSNADIVLTPGSTSSTTSTRPIIVSGSGSYITAPYFNATSDRRLKNNINFVTSSALDIILSTPVCSFNLLDSPEDKQIGLIAQDLIGKELDGVALYVKPEDYYQIKESKLIYVLWKAVQEQQKEIEMLKNRIL